MKDQSSLNNDDNFLSSYQPFLPNYDQKMDTYLQQKEIKKEDEIAELCWETPK